MTNRLKFATGFMLLIASTGCGGTGEHKATLGSHTLIIVDASGEKPLGGTLGTHQDDPAKTTTHYFESANGRYKITLVNELLTINGDKYALEKPGSEIRVVDDQVEINGVPATANQQ